MQMHAGAHVPRVRVAVVTQPTRRAMMALRLAAACWASALSPEDSHTVLFLDVAAEHDAA